MTVFRVGFLWTVLSIPAICVGCSSTTSIDPRGEDGDSGGTDSGGSSGTGTGGAATGGGSGTGGSGPECSSPTDCPALPCHELGSCVDGECRPGGIVSVCASLDEAHCVCAELGDGTCGIRGKDSDNDGHRDHLCTGDLEADDCDDACSACYPGASEICDGFDNDCNGSKDVFDELPLWGQAEVLVENGAAKVVWWPDANAYAAIVTNYADPRRIEFSLLRADGTIAVEPVDLSAAIGLTISGPHAVSGVTLGLLQGSSDAPPTLYRFDSSGQLLGQTAIVPGTTHPEGSFSSAALVSNPAGGWHAVYAHRASGASWQAYLARFAADGTQQGDTAGLMMLEQGIATAPIGTRLIHANDSETSPRLVLVAGNGTMMDSRSDLLRVRALGGDGSVVGLVQDDGVAVAGFSELNADLDVTCGPVPTTYAGGGNDPVVSSTGGLWINYVTDQGIAGIDVIERGCGQAQWIPLASSAPYGMPGGTTAVSPKGALLVWRSSASYALLYRAVGPNLCDEPLP